METLTARVEKGRLVLDEPTTLPEGTVLELCCADTGDELDSKGRAALKEALCESWAAARAGRMRPVEKLLEDLKPR